MLILAIDSAASSCGVCVWQNGSVLATQREAMLRGQDARLMPMVVEVMRQAGIDYPQLDKIAVTRGPGSFTGLRVGLAAARGLGIATHKPVLGIDRFMAYRRLHADTQTLLVVLESKRAELFCRFYPDGEAVMITQAEIDVFMAAHSGTKIVGDITTPEDDILPICAALASESDTNDPDFIPQPLYLRAPDVTFPKTR